MYRTAFLLIGLSLALGFVAGWHAPHVIERRQLQELARRCKSTIADHYSAIDPPFLWEHTFPHPTSSFSESLSRLDAVVDDQIECALFKPSDYSHTSSDELMKNVGLIDKYTQCTIFVIHHTHNENFVLAETYAEIAMQLKHLASRNFEQLRHAYLQRPGTRYVYCDNSFAESLSALGRYSDAQEIIESAELREAVYEKDSDEGPDAWRSMILVSALFGQHKYQEALSVLNEPAETEADQVSLDLLLGPCLLALGQDSSAKALGERIRHIRKSPMYLPASVVPGASRERINKLADELISMSKCYAQDPLVPPFLDAMIDIFQSRGCEGAAKTLQQEVKRLRSRDKKWWLRI